MNRYEAHAPTASNTDPHSIDTLTGEIVHDYLTMEEARGDVADMNREAATADRDRAAEARHGGRYITEQLASGYPDTDAKTLRSIQDKGDPAAVSRYWAFALSPSGGTGSGRDSTESAMRKAADIGGVDWAHSAYWQAPKLPESAFDWPIYVSAYTQPTEDCQSYGHRDPFYGDSVIPESENRALHGDR